MPTKLSDVIGPMPDQLVKEIPTDASAGSQIRIRSSATAPVPVSAWTGAVGVVVGSATAQMICPVYFSGGRESQNCCIVLWRLDGFAVGLARKFSRNCCMPLGPA